MSGFIYNTVNEEELSWNCVEQIFCSHSIEIVWLAIYQCILHFSKSVPAYFLAYACCSLIHVNLLYIFLWSKACLDVPRTTPQLKIAFTKEGKGTDMKANTIQSLKPHSVKMLTWYIQRFQTLNIKHARNATETFGSHLLIIQINVVSGHYW